MDGYSLTFAIGSGGPGILSNTGIIGALSDPSHVAVGINIPGGQTVWAGFGPGGQGSFSGAGQVDISTTPTGQFPFPTQAPNASGNPATIRQWDHTMLQIRTRLG